MCANYQTEYPLVVQCDESAYSEVFLVQEVSFGGMTTHLRKIGPSTVKLMRLYYLIK